MRAYIKLWGHEHLIKSICWYEDDEISHISFFDEKGELRTIFQLSKHQEEQLDRSIDEKDILLMDLEKEVYWKKGNKKMPFAEDI